MPVYHVAGRADVYLLNDSGQACARTTLKVDQYHWSCYPHDAREAALDLVRAQFPGEYVCWSRVDDKIGTFDVRTTEEQE